MTAPFNNNNGHIQRLHGEQLRGVQQRFLSAILRRPSLVPTILRSDIRPKDFPVEWRNAFVVATKEPGRGREIAASADGDATIRRLFTQVVELGHGQALRMAEQILFNARRRDVVKSDEAAEELERQ